MMDELLNRKLLNEEVSLLQKSMETLLLSVEKCIKIVSKESHTFEEMESFDSLTSKFGRTYDLFTQKVLRTIWILLHEPFVPFIDLLNKAEKLSIIHSAEQLIEIRDVRNQITHEYIPEAIMDLIPDVIQLSRLLIKNIEACQQFMVKRHWITD